MNSILITVASNKGEKAVYDVSTVFNRTMYRRILTKMSKPAPALLEMDECLSSLLGNSGT